MYRGNPNRRLVTRLVTLALVLTAVFSLSIPTASAATSELGLERQLVDLINHERKARGLSALSTNLQLKRIARAWSATMDRNNRLYHNPNLSKQVDGDWRRLGENVGVGPSISSLHNAFMNSSGHRANVLGDYNQVNVGVVLDGSRIWVTVNFLKGPKGGFPLFSDADSGSHVTNISRIWLAELTNGCSFSNYCPDRAVTRAEMATFLARALDLAPVTSRRFADVPRSHTHFANINAVAAAGITVGCRDKTVFCPDRKVTRAEMATFLARALELAPVGGNVFVDVPRTSSHRENINAIAKDGITVGCKDKTYYCPDRKVTRAEMATFLTRGFDL